MTINDEFITLLALIASDGDPSEEDLINALLSSIDERWEKVEAGVREEHARRREGQLLSEYNGVDYKGKYFEAEIPLQEFYEFAGPRIDRQLELRLEVERAKIALTRAETKHAVSQAFYWSEIISQWAGGDKKDYLMESILGTAEKFYTIAQSTEDGVVYLMTEDRNPSDSDE